MSAPEDAAGNRIEPLDPARHDRAAFSCGTAQVDNFFRQTANKLTRAGNLRTFVMVDPSGAVIGFYAVNAHAIDYAELPDRFARTRPAHGSIPAAYIAMIGVDRRFQGGGYGGDLLVDCLARLAHAADALGIAVVMLDVLDCGNPGQVARRRALYTGYGFQPLPSNDLRLFLPMATVRALLAED
ncbi:GNAT family N-acetyltransferase [Sphingomonas desiccabilis]|uniref:N-acetyltransferase n=1 Tax=Sphingomonas desiccabilis TaxID=429134 RepID=A0A4Q2IVQ9_9SPHN|nr:GNAT family N-acetyltransferase [Sphingomonas desiccabilis]MBB3912686.1 GNAT superfamily N-acetyltransferase [Sphingomonas desiccabilis]RXZ34655.1 N-acetyltransferase [Sphingomonas desiccabilis]